jgi:1-acyl-sn-glycerol-3-phosphate acyltransferase
MLICFMNLWVYTLIILWTLIGSLVSFPLLLFRQLFSKWSLAKNTRLFVWIYAKICVLIVRPFIRLEIEGVDRERLPSYGIFVINHYSFFDTYLLSMLPVFDLCVWAKAWPFKMVWYSFYMRLSEYIDVESLSWEDILVKAKKAATKGCFVVGAFKLAVQTGTPICPICITGTQDLLRPGQLWFRPATIKMRLLDPVSPEQFSGERPHAEMCNHVRNQIIETLERIES